jgi:hypothetical protein
LLKDETLVSLLGVLLNDAEFVAVELAKRVKEVAEKFVPPHGNPDPKDVARLSDALDARPAYWARLEGHFLALLNDLPEKGIDAVAAWRAQVEREAEHAFRESCRQLGQTPQAIRARAAVSFGFQANEVVVTQERAERKKQAELNRKKEGKERERTAR